MTLDGVAQAAGVSKGGLLYHFPSKESLLGALAKRYVESMEIASSGEGRHQRARPTAAILKACIIGILGQQPRSKSGMGAALFADGGERPDAARSDSRAPRRLQPEMRQRAVDFARAAIVTLAIDGLMMRESLRISSFTDQQRQHVVSS